MKELYEKAAKNMEAACKGSDDMCAVCFWSGYLVAIRDINKKLKAEGLDELED